MRRCIVGSLIAVLLLVGCSGGDDDPEIVAVSITAEPNGPSAVASDDGDVPLERVTAAVPEPLPPSPAQLCDRGVRLVLRFADDVVVVYGPCTLPPGIEAVRRRLVREVLRSRGDEIAAASSGCGEDVISDWYSEGRIGSVYPLFCYARALEMMPHTWPAPSSVQEAVRRAAAAAAVGKLDS